MQDAKIAMDGLPKGWPLTAHSRGQWCKRITGAPYNPIMFGPLDDPNGALERYKQEKDDWAAGRNPRKMVSKTGVNWGILTDTWLDLRESLVGSPIPTLCISHKTYNSSAAAVTQLLTHVCRTGSPLKMSQSDWKELHQKLGAGVSPGTWNNRVMMIRAMLHWAAGDGRLLPRLPDWGRDFNQIPTDHMRELRYLFQKEHGERIFRIDAARLLLRHVHQAVLELPARVAAAGAQNGGGHKVQWAMEVSALNFRAATFLAANTGTQGADIAGLAEEDVDLDVGWIDTLRQKTKVPWQAPLWPETVRFIREAQATRPQIRTQALRAWREHRAKYLHTTEMRAKAMNAYPLLVTADGYPLVHVSVGEDQSRQRKDGTSRRSFSGCNAIEQASWRLMPSLGLKERGLNFGAWRPTFQTLAAGSGRREDKGDHIDRIFGHKLGGSRDPYVRFTREDLAPVTDYVRSKLLDEPLISLLGQTGESSAAASGGA